MKKKQRQNKAYLIPQLLAFCGFALALVRQRCRQPQRGRHCCCTALLHCLLHVGQLLLLLVLDTLTLLLAQQREGVLTRLQGRGGGGNKVRG